jgi:hypothetical protein
MMALDRLPPLFTLAAVTALLLFSLRPAPRAGLRRWKDSFTIWLARLPWMRNTQWSRRLEQRYQPNPGAAIQAQGRLALGLGLASYFETQTSLEQTLLNQISWLRRELFLDTGMVMPSLTVVQERNLHPFEYSLTFGAKELARGSILPAHWLIALDERPEWAGDREMGRHPVSGRPTFWVTSNELPQALASGARCEDGLELFAHHLRHALWQNTTSFVTVEFCQQFLGQGLERSPQVRMFRRALETNQPRLVALLQLVLAMGGSLRDPGRLLFHAGSGFLRGEPIETIARRVVDSCPRGLLRDSSPPSSLSSALLYSYFWNEHLSSDLLSRSDPDSLESLALGMLEVQNLPPVTLEQMWFDTLATSEVFLLGRSTELAEQLHQMLSQSGARCSRLGKSEQAAILLLSLPRELGQYLTSSLMRELSRAKVEELIQAMGRFGYLLLQAPPGQGMRQLTELGFRERIISEFLDFVNYQTVKSCPEDANFIDSWMHTQRHLPLDDLAYAFESYYFPTLEPVTRLRRAVEQDPQRVRRGLVAFAQGESLPVSAAGRASVALEALPSELQSGVAGRLRGRGCLLPQNVPTTPRERTVCQWEFFQRLARPYCRSGTGSSCEMPPQSSPGRS